MSANGYVVEVFTLGLWIVAHNFRPLGIENSLFANVDHAHDLAVQITENWPFTARILGDEGVVATYKDGHRLR